MNFSAPLPKVRAVSPNCVRLQHKLSTASQPSPQHKIITATQPSPQHKVMTTPQPSSQHKVISTPQPSPQLIPRGQQITTPIRPQQHLPNPSSLPVNTGKIRVRAPIVQANVQRPSITVRPPVPQYAQVLLFHLLLLICLFILYLLGHVWLVLWQYNNQLCCRFSSIKQGPLQTMQA